ncbi:MAG TPA: four helix bundle protein [Anaeromyxobacteraceae bacterium]|nr:four helix bundle protein [Anaeromyxobacteraceae bacterium]
MNDNLFRNPELDGGPGHDPILVHDRELDRDHDPCPDREHDPDRSPDLDRSPGRIRLPHHKLVAYTVARDLLLAVRAAEIRDGKLRDEALRSAKSAALNCAEGAGRVSRADKARAFTIARGEAVEAAAAVEIAALCGDVRPVAAREVERLADRLVALLTGLVR